MSARILYISDFHKRDTDLSSIKGLVKVQRLVQEELLKYVQANDVTHIIIGGDWYDRGYHGIGPAYGAIEMDRRLSDAVNGEVYLCIGNHFYLERDENPEMYIIQPNDYIQPQFDMPMPDKPIFKLVPQLCIGTVQIDFFHFNKINKRYVAYRNKDTTFHIGVYHDDMVLPNWIREQEGYHGTTTQSVLNEIYDNVDLGLHGHIHCRIGTTSIQLTNGRKVPICVPGALSITQNRDIFKHSYVELPLIDIDDNSNVNFTTVKFSTHMDELSFYAKKAVKKVTPATEVVSGKVPLTTSAAELHSLPVFMQKKGYSQNQLKLMDLALNNTLNITTAIMALSEVEEVE